MSKIKVGDTVLIEQAWEDEGGVYHDEYAEVSLIRDDGTLRFRLDNKKIQYFINKFEWTEDEVTVVGALKKGKE